MRKWLAGPVGVALLVTSLLAGTTGAGATDATEVQAAVQQEYVVLYAEGVAAADAHAAIAAAGGTVVSENTQVGVATITSSNADFRAAAGASAAIEGTAENRFISQAPDDAIGDDQARKIDEAEAETAKAAGTGAGPAAAAAAGAEPLAGQQWDMQQIGATATGSHRYEQGSKKVLVGIIDTGVDGKHPDIAPNFNAALSRNFTTDLPTDANGTEIDGACEADPDGLCTDPANVDENGHGTHVASTIASPINGLGIAGVAPKVSIVNLRAGQDSGYFFLKPSVDALTYAADHGIDVVNMSYYVDPWLFNCADNPADSPDQQAQQRTITAAMQRALDYAYGRGVTLIGAAGNQAADYTKTYEDGSSPDFASTPGEEPHDRTIPPSCTSMPAEGNHVIAVSSTGISTRMAYYSSYGNGYVDLAAPGGDVYDTPTGARDVTKAILAAYPEAVGRAAGAIDSAGNPAVDFVVKNCNAAGTCAYYQYIQGTSMAAPHAAGVAALVVSRFGLNDRRDGGKYLPPAAVQAALQLSATRTPCPTPPTYTYTRILPSGVTVTSTETCEGSRLSNGFYGTGIVSALRAIGR